MSLKKSQPFDDASEREGAGENGAGANVTDPKNREPDLEDRLKAAEQDAAEMHDRYLRAVAELENVKKRSEREIASFRKFANEFILKDLLGVVDNLERAIASAAEEKGPAQLVEGVDLTLKELLKTLKKYHVEPITSLGECFDPTYHQAVMEEPSAAHPDRTVIRELQKGYTMSDRLLRPAMVVVSRKETSSSEKNDNHESQEKKA